MRYYVGIDPGATGALAVIDNAGNYVAAHRWDQRNPYALYNILLLIRDRIDTRVYIEAIHAHPREGVAHVTRNQALVVNYGIWQGYLIAAQLSYTTVHPATWQANYHLTHWQKRLTLNPRQPTPLTTARALWPPAPLQYQVDDGKAVALLLANLARQDHLQGLDRHSLNLQRASTRRNARKPQPVNTS